MGTTSTAPVYFTGTSAYSSDFSNLVARAVAIAQLPITQLTANQTALTKQSDEVTTLNTKFTALQSAVASIGDALSGSSYKSTVSTDKVLDVNISSGAQEGYYTMNVSSIGAYAASTSTADWNVPEVSGKPTTFTLVVGNRNYSVTGKDNSPQAIVDAINANYGDLVQANTVHLKSGQTSISLQSTTLGKNNLDILQIPTVSATPPGLQAQSADGYAISQTTASWDASGTAAATYTLTVGNSHFTVTPDSNSAEDVAKAVNALDGGQLRASVVDLGTGDNHDFRISLQGTTAGLINGSTELNLQRVGGQPLQTQQIAASSRSTLAWDGTADAKGSRSTYNLVIGSDKYAFTPDSNSAADVAAAINSVYGGQVHASVIDLGTADSPDYRISLQGPAGTSYDIQKSTVTHYQDSQVAGSLASYEINNSGVVNTSNTRDILVSTGVTATLVGTSGGTPPGSSSVGITVTRSDDALNRALSTFTDAYNAIVTELIGQRGQSGGALQGNSLVNQLSGVLSGIATFSSGNGKVNGLKSIGLDLQMNGQIAFSPVTLMAVDFTSSSEVATYFGSVDGGGFLKNATDALATLVGSTAGTGLLSTTGTDLKAQAAKIGTTISSKQAAVEAMQIQMQNQMARADALIASMEQQYSYLSGMFSAQSTADQMYK